jgi:hypothetical protein
MKKLFTTLFLVLGIFSLAKAQQSKGIEFGVGIGLNSATIIEDYDSRNGLKWGFNIALSADKYFSDKWSLKLKAIYDQKGTRNGMLSEGDILYNRDVPLNYITVPVMANLHFGKTRNWYFNFGPYAGFLLDAKTSSIAGKTYSIKHRFNSVDVGLGYGIGVKIPVAKKLKFFIETEAQNGVTKLYKSTYLTEATRTFRGSFNIGLNF